MMPPLRDRIDAVPLLTDHFLQMYNEQYRKEASSPSQRGHDAA